MRIIFILIISIFWNTDIVKGEEVNRDSIVSALKLAYQRDQAPRKIIDSLMRLGVTDGNKYLPAIKQQEEADIINLKLALPIIDTIYKLGLYDLDTIAYKSCWIIIQHAPNDILSKYESFIKQLVIRDLISKQSYMAYTDRLRVRNSRAQIYGPCKKMVYRAKGSCK